jgi:hypothetical protein
MTRRTARIVACTLRPLGAAEVRLGAPVANSNSFDTAVNTAATTLNADIISNS